MNIDLTGKRAIICGGSRGIGRSIAHACAEAGADVSICARGAETLAKTREEIAAFGHKAHAATCDVRDPALVSTLLSVVTGTRRASRPRAFSFAMLSSK